MSSEVFGYARVSSSSQNSDRQIQQLVEAGVKEDFIFRDIASGKNFDRKAYNSLVGTDTTLPRLRRGDSLVICSLDRLGRNYIEIQEQWKLITNDIGASIKVLDMPLLDTRKGGNNSLEQSFISDLVLQILSYVAEKERISIKERQRQGIAVAKAQGKHLGRPKQVIPSNWEDVYRKWRNGEMTAKKAMDELGMKRGVFYKYIKQYEGEKER